MQSAEKIEMPMRDKVDPRVFLPGVVNLFCLGCAVAGVSTLVSACDRYRWRTIGIVAGLYIVSMILKIVGPGVRAIRLAQAAVALHRL